MDKKSIKEYIDLLEDSNLSSLRIKTDKGELHIEKKPGQHSFEPVIDGDLVPKKEKDVSRVKNTFNAPMVGTFYRSSGPGEKPFVKVGDEVKTDDVLCILEAMKVMNEIKSDRCGIVKEVLVEDAMCVEYNQVLFVIE